MELSQVTVNDRLPAILSSRVPIPAATPKDGMLTWVIDTLAPNASKKMTVTGAAKEVGWVQNCADATYVILACAKTQVVQPALTLAKECPAEVLLCDQIPLKYTVCNKGTGMASNVMITDTLPDGLTLATGQKTVDIKVGDLAPGKCMTYTVMAKAAKTGSYKSGAMAKADGNLKAESEVCSTVVKQPVLAITKTGPEKQYLGRRVTYEITVANKGDAPATNLVVTDTIPAGVSEVVASDGGQVATGLVTWNLGTLAAGQSRKVTVSYLPQAAGSFERCGHRFGDLCRIRQGHGQDRRGGNRRDSAGSDRCLRPDRSRQERNLYHQVTNQGSAPDTDIKVVCKLEEAMQFVSASGATTGSLPTALSHSSRWALWPPRPKRPGRWKSRPPRRAMFGSRQA